MTAADMKALFQAQFPSARIEVEGEDQVHFTAKVVCDSFSGMTRVKRQQVVYAVLGDRFKTGEVHALSLQALTPEEASRS